MGKVQRAARTAIPSHAIPDCSGPTAGRFTVSRASQDRCSRDARRFQPNTPSQRGGDAQPRVTPRGISPHLARSRPGPTPSPGAPAGVSWMFNYMESSPVIAALQPVQPVKPPAGYLGGKRNLSRKLVAQIAAIPHTLYAEPFVGMGGIFFRRTTRPPTEVINDISADVATLFRILQRHYQPFLDMLRWRFASRHEFERLLAIDPSTCTDLERAARFLYLQRNAFGGKVVGRSFGVSYSSPSKFRLSLLEPMLQDIHDRLDGVYIERLPYRDFIRRYDRPGALFYLDPPYAGCEGDYGPGVFSADDFACLAELLANLKGRFVLSINDTPAIRDTFAAFNLSPVELTYRVSGQATAARELIITGEPA